MFKEVDMADTRTLEVTGFFGKPKQITKEDFVRRWVNHASELRHLGIDVVEKVREAAGADFEETWKRQNP
jgi:hypothetical protein